MPTFTTLPGQVSASRTVSTGAVVTVTPALGGTAFVEYTTGTRSDINNNVAVWKPWPKGTISAVAGSAIPSIADRANNEIHIRVTATGAPVTTDINNDPNKVVLAPLQADWTSGIATVAQNASGLPTGIQTAGGTIPLPLSNPRGKLVIVGDSLTEGGSQRACGVFDGRPYYNVTFFDGGGVVPASFGGGSWLVDALVDGRAPVGTGSLQTDGAGRLRWTVNGDTPGPFIDVSTTGGFFLLNSGTQPYPIFVRVRGNTTPPAAPATTAITTAGVQNIGSYNLYGYGTWVASALADTFSDYQMFGIIGATSFDIGKFLPQAFQADVEAVVYLATPNDSPATAAAAAASIAQHKANIDYMAARARRVYVGDILPNPSATAVVQRYSALISNEVRKYCRGKFGVEFWSAYDKMINSNSVTIAGRTGIYNADNLHLIPFGAYTAAQAAVNMIAQDYVVERARKTTLDTYDATLKSGAWNANPGMRGTAGVVTASVGITGTAPDSWSINRSGTAQVCTTTFDTANDGGADWFSLAVSGSASGDYHVIQQGTAVPAGVNVGDFFRASVEFQIFACTGGGLAVVQAQANSTTQNDYLVQASGRNVATFTTEQPVLRLYSEPQKLLAGNTTFNLAFRIGAAVGGTGKIGIRDFRLESVPGPIYP